MAAAETEISYELMRVLHVLLSTRSVTRAAERLGVSQPTVSRSLARLRRQFDDPLLVRCGAGMVLTPRAERLLDPLAAWLAEGRAFLRPECFEPARIDRTLRVAATDSGVLSVLAPSLPEITEHAPGCSVVVEPYTAQSLRRLADGNLDIVVTGLPAGEGAVHARYLFTEEFLLLLRDGHPLANPKAQADLDALLSWPHIAVNVLERGTDPIDAAMQALGKSRKIGVQVDKFAVVPYLLAQSEAVAILPATIARRFAALHGLRAFRPPIDPGTFDYSLVWHERSKRDAATMWFADVLAARFRPRSTETQRCRSKKAFSGHG